MEYLDRLRGGELSVHLIIQHELMVFGVGNDFGPVAEFLQMGAVSHHHDPIFYWFEAIDPEIPVAVVA